MAASSDDVHVAYGWNGLFIYDTSSGSIAQAGVSSATRWSIAFSPTGDQVFAAGLSTGVTVDGQTLSDDTVTLHWAT